MTSTQFNTRFNNHRSNFKNNISIEQSDKYALAIHYRKSHNQLQPLPQLEEAYELVFLEKPDTRNLKVCEDKWKHLTKSTINIQKMITPNIH